MYNYIYTHMGRLEKGHCTTSLSMIRINHLKMTNHGFQIGEFLCIVHSLRMKKKHRGAPSTSLWHPFAPDIARDYPGGAKHGEVGL